MHYDIAPETVTSLIQSTIEEFHPELVEAQVTVDAVMAYNDKGFPIKEGGYPSLAVTKINSLVNRIKGFADVTISLDGEAFDSMSEAEQKALIDRQLYCLTVVRDKEQNVKVDDSGRPKTRIKKCDYRLSWFREIAVRHKENSPEVYQAKLLWNNDGKTFFPQV